MNGDIDLDYRPATYFGPQKLEQYLLSKVKGAVVREKLQSLFAEGRHANVRDLLTSEALSARDRKALESFHPMFMGGNYLPDTEDGEVEIARISIKSTTFDVTRVYAKPDVGVIRYRVVDEYGGDTLQGRPEAQTTQPMTLGEFTDFFLRAWPLIDVLEMNFEGDQAGALGFFSADSEFYPDLDRLCRQRVRKHFPDDEPEWDAGDRCPICDYFNSPPADDTCEHICAWVWDGQIEALRHGEALETSLRELAELVSTTDDGSVEGLILKAEAQCSQTRSQLIDIASRDLNFEEALTSLANAELGSGWSTEGMLGGSGYNLYVPNPEQLGSLATECQACIDACKMKIETAGTAQSTLESRRPKATVKWRLVASGFWSEDMYHSGYIAYYIANTGPGEWIMESVERNAELDGVTEEEVEEGRLNDDQIQAMWGQTLEEAQNAEYREIVAACSGANPKIDAKEMAAVLYRAVCSGGGKEITEPDTAGGLLGF